MFILDIKSQYHKSISDDLATPKYTSVLSVDFHLDAEDITAFNNDKVYETYEKYAKFFIKGLIKYLSKKERIQLLREMETELFASYLEG